MNNRAELLRKQIDELGYDIYVDSYPMSLGELNSLYKDGDINLKADYQRVFKWSDIQKTRLIESFLLGLPIPPIFLYQDENALWEVVDGIQRLSTVFEFFGNLKKPDGEYEEELTLVSAPKLTYLEGLKYSDFSDELKRSFKKCKLDLIIISKKSKKDIKLEVFRRLNGFGTTLNKQELRNALTLLLNPSLFEFIEKMTENKTFLKCFPFNKNEIKDKKQYEYFVRYLTLYENKTLASYKIDKSSTIDDLFDKVIENIANGKSFNLYDVEINFIKTFELLYSTIGEDVFKKYSHDNNRFQGRISESIFEMIIPGVSRNVEYYMNNPKMLEEKIKNISLKDSLYTKALSTNPKAIDRMKRLYKASLEYFESYE